VSAPYPCLECANAYDSADDALRCRLNGLLTSPANAADCRRFEPDVRTDEDATDFVCACDWIGRGD
jgi:hypothetical protein